MGQFLFLNEFMEKVIPWFRLKKVPGVGNHLCKCLIDRFQTPQNVFGASHEELTRINGVSKQLAGAILSPYAEDDIKREIDIAFKLNCQIITLADPQYPALLSHIHDPPPYIYVKGELGNTKNSIAVVGSRQASGYGISIAKKLSTDLSLLGLTVVSGMALGIDAAAHEGALLANGKTIAVLGSGLGVIYPHENKAFFDRIIKTGAVISELPVMEQPNSYNFPARNRIISGMTLGTVVVEAAQKSGSLITARLAAEQGREVFAVPGSINSLKSAGTHNLLKQGAKLVASAKDIIEELPPFSYISSNENINVDATKEQDQSASLDMTPEEIKIYKLIEPYPVHIDDISQKSGMEVGKLAGILLNLELRGIVNQMPGKYFYMSEDKH